MSADVASDDNSENDEVKDSRASDDISRHRGTCELQHDEVWSNFLLVPMYFSLFSKINAEDLYFLLLSTVRCA